METKPIEIKIKKQFQREIIWTLSLTVIALGFVIFLNSQLPKNPMPWELYLTPDEYYLQLSLSILFLILLVCLGIFIGYYYVKLKYFEAISFILKEAEGHDHLA